MVRVYGNNRVAAHCKDRLDISTIAMLRHIRRGNADRAYTQARLAAHAGLLLIAHGQFIDSARAETKP